MKKIVALLLTALILVTAACSGKSDADALVGTWNIKDMQGEGIESDFKELSSLIEAFGAKLQYVFEKGGKGKMIVSALGQSQETELTWKLDGGKLVMTDEDGSNTSLNYTLSGDSLTLEDSGYKMILERAK